MANSVLHLCDETEMLLDAAEQKLDQLEAVTLNKLATAKSRSSKEKQPVSQETNAKARNKNREANQAAVALLVENYPQAFNSEEPKPLKIGIQEDLVSDEKVSRSKIKRALATYVRNPRYLKSLVEGADRVDLQGESTGKVSAEEEQHAKAKLDEYKQRRVERQKEQRKAQRVAEKEQRLSSKLEQLVAKTNKH